MENVTWKSDITFWQASSVVAVDYEQKHLAISSIRACKRSNCASVWVCPRMHIRDSSDKVRRDANLYDREKVSDVIEQRRISFRSSTASLSIRSDVAGINISFRMSRVSRFEVSADFWERFKGKISSGKLSRTARTFSATLASNVDRRWTHSPAICGEC